MLSVTMTLAQLRSALLFMMLPVSAHIALWDPAMYGSVIASQASCASLIRSLTLFYK